MNGALKHRSPEQLELYALHRLTDTEEIETEEHLLACEACRMQLDEIGDFAYAMRDVLQHPETLPSPSAISGWSERLRNAVHDALSWKPQLAFAGAMAAVLLSVALYASLHRAPAESHLLALATLELSANRGDVPSARPAREMNLTLLGAPAESDLRVEIVTETGATVWTGTPQHQPGPSSPVGVDLSKPLEPGLYLARLYRNPAKLIHEYGFRITE